MRCSLHPSRLAEIAEILATGLMRLRARQSTPLSAHHRESSRRLSRPPERSCRPGFSGGRNVTDTVPARIAALKAQPITNLKQQWRELFETEPPPYNRRFLEHRLAYRIQEFAYGGLKPETIKRLKAIAEDLDGGDPARRRRLANRNIDACLYVRPSDRTTLERLVADGKTPQKIVARARIVLLSGRGFGTNSIQREGSGIEADGLALAESLQLTRLRLRPTSHV